MVPCLLFATAMAAPPARHPVETLYEEAVAAADRQDWPAYLSAVEQALALAPGQPALQRRRAEALAQLGRSDEALRILQGLATWGVATKPAENKLLAPLHDLPGWPAVLTAAAAALEPRGDMALSFTLAEADLVPEGIAYDPLDDVFYVSSVARRKIVRVERAGSAADFIATLRVRARARSSPRSSEH